MNNYPLCLIGKEIFPVLGRELSGRPMYFPLDDSSDVLRVEKTTKDGQKELQTAIENMMAENDATWAISGYPEKRAQLADYTDEVRENRPWHIGVDVSAPAGTKLYAPLDSVVVIAEVDVCKDGVPGYKGGYGGYVVLKHDVDDCVFYTVYGHLNFEKLPKIGTTLSAGDCFGEMGNMNQNGNWFYHVHMQVLTQCGFDEGWAQKGLCSEEQIAIIHELCPNPLFLII